MAIKPPKQSPQTTPKSDQPQPKSYEKVIARWTVVLGLSTIVLAVATGISAYFLSETDKTIGKQVDAVRIQLRAYVGPSSFAVVKTIRKEEGKPDVQTGVNVAVAWKNFGATPAKNMTGWISAKWFANGLEPNFGIPLDNISEQNAAIIGPGQEVGSGVAGVPISDIQKALARDGRIFVWGHSDYQDSFPGTPVRHFHFCGIIEFSTPENPVVTVYKTACNYAD